MDAPHLPAPVLVLDDSKVRNFESLWARAAADGGELAYDSPHPKHEFLCWLGETQDVVLHGSNEMDITEFKPVRVGFDANPHGNHRAVYATNDGIWPMFFAVLDKTTYQGSMRNGVMWVADDGRELDFAPAAANQGGRKVYQFSLNADELPRRPWREAMIYILPRRTFEQLRDRDGVLIAEWASREPVTPIAKLRVVPEDFPFVNAVAGHDDSHILRLNALFDELVGAADGFEEMNDGYTLVFARGEAQRVNAVTFGETLRGFMSAAVVDVDDADAGTMRVCIRGPEALKDATARRITARRKRN